MLASRVGEEPTSTCEGPLHDTDSRICVRHRLLALRGAQASGQVLTPPQVLQSLKQLAKEDVTREVVSFVQRFEFKKGKKKNLCYYLPPLTTSGPGVVEVVYRMELLLQTCGDEQLKMQLEQVIPMLDEHLIGALSISDGGKPRPGNEAHYSEEINNCYNIIDHGMNNFAKRKQWKKAQAYWVYEEYRTERKPKNNFDFVVGQFFRVTVETAPTEGIVQAAPLFDFRLAEADHRQPLWKSYPHGKPADMSGVYVYYVERSGSRGEQRICPPIRRPGSVVFSQ